MTTFINYMRTLDFNIIKTLADGKYGLVTYYDSDTIKTLADGKYDLLNYYVDATQVYDKYKDELWKLLCETAEDTCPGRPPISAMNFSRASCHEMFVTDFVNYIAMLVAQKIIEDKWVKENYPQELSR